MIGAGYIGLEMAENLHHRGAVVDVVEMADQILPPLDREMSIPVEHHLTARRHRPAPVHRGRGVRVPPRRRPPRSS